MLRIRNIFIGLFGGALVLLSAGVASAACEIADGAAQAGRYYQAVNYYRMCIDSGKDAASMYKLGTLYYKGLGVSAADKKVAKAYYQKAAEMGYAPAQMMLGLMLMKGEEGSVDRVEGYKWLLLAAEKPENKWIYLIEDTGDGSKAASYLAKFAPSVGKGEQNEALKKASLFKQNQIFNAVKKLFVKEDYQEFMKKYEDEKNQRAKALQELKQKMLEYKRIQKGE